MRGFAPDLDLGPLFAPDPGPPVVMAGHAPDGTFILAVGAGPLACSASRVLDRRTVHDVKGFYAALGVSRRAARGQLAAAYVAAGGSASARLTMILKILLDPASRSIYDGLQLGQRFLDPDTEAELRRAESARILKKPCTDSGKTVYEVVERAPYWGDGRPGRTDTPQPQDFEHEHEDGYAHYLWNVPVAGNTALTTWRHLLIAALDEDGGPPITFAVGHRAPGTAAAVLLVQGHPAAFLSHGSTPTQEQARHVAHQIRALAEPAEPNT